MQINTKLLLSLSLIFSASLSAAKSKSVAVSVNIRPAVAVTVQGAGAAEVKIRLNSEAHARVWKDENCATVPAKSYTITQSGIYNLNLAQIDGTGSRLCLASSDGTLSKSVTLPANSTPAGF